MGGAVADASARAHAPSTTAGRDRPGAASQSLLNRKVATDSSGAVVRQPIARLGSGVPFHRQRTPAFALLLGEVARINRMTAPGDTSAIWPLSRAKRKSASFFVAFVLWLVWAVLWPH